MADDPGKGTARAPLRRSGPGYPLILKWSSGFKPFVAGRPRTAFGRSASAGGVFRGFRGIGAGSAPPGAFSETETGRVFPKIFERRLTGFSKTGRDAACLTGSTGWRPIGDESGEVAEWLKAPLSKSGILATTGIVGSNPTLSATFFPAGMFSAGIVVVGAGKIRRDDRVG